MSIPGSQFHHERNPQLHASDEVEYVVGYLRASGETIPNQPADKLDAYLGFMSNREFANDGILTGDQASIDRQIDAHVIKSEDVPEAYFELQRRIAREQGRGEIEITQDMRSQLIEAVQADQKAGLGKWVEYVGGEDGGYPDWFKKYTWDSVVKLGSFDKEKGEFQKRSKGTTAPYPELNREALAYVFDVVHKSKVQKEKVDGGANDEKLQKLLQSANFGKLYAHAVLEVTPDSPELRKEIQGSWTKFNQTDDPRTARRLSGSLQGHGTGWCTAGESTAEMQLQGGDFYVYYTQDEDDKDTIPRIAIRMENDEVAEVRGINPSQELEPVMTDIALEQLTDLPGGDAYIKKADDMKKLTAIERKLARNPDEQITINELRFLYEVDSRIQGFGYGRDPRIEQILSKRDFIQDLSQIFATNDHNVIASNLIDVQRSGALAENLDKFEGVDHKDIARRMLDDGKVHSLVNNLDKFEGVDHNEIVNRMLDSKNDYYIRTYFGRFQNLDNDTAHRLLNSEFPELVSRNLNHFQKLDKDIAEYLMDNGEIWVLPRSLDSFEGVDHNQIAHRLIGSDNANILTDNIWNFQNLDNSVANYLIDSGQFDLVARNLARFQHLSSYTMRHLENKLSIHNALHKRLRRVGRKTIDAVKDRFLDAT